jgi:hypothetical protein
MPFADAKAGKQNIRDNNAARVAGPGRIFFKEGAQGLLVSLSIWNQADT